MAKTLLEGKSIIIDDMDISDDVIIENRDVGKVIFIEVTGNDDIAEDLEREDMSKVNNKKRLTIL